MSQSETQEQVPLPECPAAAADIIADRMIARFEREAEICRSGYRAGFAVGLIVGMLMVGTAVVLIASSKAVVPV